jgi:hypothetical protein
MGHVACKLPQNTREAFVVLQDKLRAFAPVCSRHAPIAHPGKRCGRHMLRLKKWKSHVLVRSGEGLVLNFEDPKCFLSSGLRAISSRT